MDKYTGSTMYVIWLHRKTRKPALAMKYGYRPDASQGLIEAMRGPYWADSADEALAKYEFWGR